MSLFDNPEFLNKVEGRAEAEAADKSVGNAFDDPAILKGTELEGYSFPSDVSEPEMILELAEQESEEGIEVEIIEEPEYESPEEYENSLITEYFDVTPDLDSMTVRELRKYLEDLRHVCELIEDDEPDAEFEEAMEAWESRKVDLRDIVGDVLDLLNDLTAIADECDLDLM